MQFILFNELNLLNQLACYYNTVGDPIHCYYDISDTTISDCFLNNFDN